MWRETTKHERNAKIFREELDGFLPEKVLDFHVHVMNDGVLPAGEKYLCAGHAIPSYTVDELSRDMAEVYPGRQTAAVCFGFPHPDYARERNNRYVSEACDHRRFFPLRLFDPHEADRAAVRGDIVRRKFLGLKPYCDYARPKDPALASIPEMLPDWIMEIADELGLIVVLHISRKGRLADPDNRRELVELCRKFPRAKVVLAHVGRAYFLKCALGNLDELAKLPNLYYDTAMVNHPEVLEHLFATVPPDRVLYATDTPIALAPGKSVEINDGYTYVTPAPWRLSIVAGPERVVFTSFLYEQLRSVKKAAERLKLGKKFLRGFFWENGMRLLAAAVRKA